MTIVKNNFSPRMLGTLVAVVFISELVMMMVLHYLPLELSVMQEALLDAIVLSVICSVVLWITVARPMKAVATTETDKFNHLLDAVPDGVIGVNKNGQIRFLNKRILALFQYSQNELVGKPIELLMPE